MDIPERLLCVFTGVIEPGDGYTIEIPASEIRSNDDLVPGKSYQVALLASPDDDAEPRTGVQRSEQPVDEGEIIEDVEIETVGSEGDGVVTVGHTGFVVFVPDVDVGDVVDIRVDAVEDTYAFGEVVTNV